LSAKRKLMKAAAWLFGIILILVGVAITSSLWRYWSWYPKTWGTNITVDGKLSPDSRLYTEIKGMSAIVRRQDGEVTDTYFVRLAPESQFVLRCEDAGVSFVPGIAVSNHVQFGKGCLSGKLTFFDWEGHVLSKPSGSLKRNLRIEQRSIEFIADDGKRIHAVW